MANDTLSLAIGVDSVLGATEPLYVPMPRPLIFDSLEAKHPDYQCSLVEIHQDQRVERLLNDRRYNTSSRKAIMTQGYRVQVYSSNQQLTARQEALEMKQEMELSFLGVPVYVIYQAPSWKVRLGDFSNLNEAQMLRKQVVEKYPDMQGDVYVVKEQFQVSQ